jgi:hypothetical protein
MGAKPLGAILLLWAVLSGCAFSPVSKPDPGRYLATVPRAATFEATEAQVIDACKSALEAIGYSVQTANADVGLVRTQVAPILVPQNCDCGSWNLAPVTGTADSVLEVRVKSLAGGLTGVEVEHLCGTRFAGQNLYGATTVQEVYRCASKGFAEKKFLETLSVVMEKRHAGPNSSRLQGH